MSSQRIPQTLRNAALTTAKAGSAGLLSVALLSTASLAADRIAFDAPDKDIEEVIVEGRSGASNPYADPMAPFKIDRSSSSKLTQSILDAAKSITIIPKELIDDTGANTFRDLMRIQPGVTLGTGEGGNAFGDRVFIRGFDARNDIYVDGIRDPGVISREIFAIEQIEIFKGPSSVFGGRGTTGGAVNMVSKAPSDKDFGDIDLTLGTANQKRITVDINHVVTDRLSIRANGMWHDSDVAGRDDIYNKRWGGSIAGTYKITDTAKLTLDFYHLETDSLPDWGVPYDVTNNKPFDVDRNNFYGILSRDFHKNNANIITARLDVELSENLSLETTMRYGKTWNAYVITAPENARTTDPDPANWTVPAGAKTRNQTNRYIGNQTNLIWTVSNHTLVGGFEYSKEKIQNRPYNFDTAEDPNGDPAGIPVPGRNNPILQNLWNPDSSVEWIWPLALSGSETTSEITTKAIFLIDTIDINEQWQVFGGLRLDDYKVVKTSIGGRSPGALTNKGTFLNWHAGVTYKPAENGSIYISYGSSSNPPGEQVDGGGSAYGGITDSNQNLNPERNKSFELGTKWALFDEHLLVTAAVFRIEKTAFDVTGGFVRNPDGSFSILPEVTTLDGKIRVDGIELGLSGSITPELSIFGGVTLLNTKVIDSARSNDIGKKLANVAEQSFTILAKYQITSDLDFGAIANYSSKILGGAGVAGGTTFIPSYVRFDAFANYRITEMIKVSLNVQNLTDKVYYDSLYRNTAPFTYIAPGRSASLTLDIEF
ncbi:MAG: TonB-dependent siderophore receptor [Emcibacter sp.]|nr:TonB-dependent siderophore receptor [Emcibacter sp.]